MARNVQQSRCTAYLEVYRLGMQSSRTELVEREEVGGEKLLIGRRNIRRDVVCPLRSLSLSLSLSSHVDTFAKFRQIPRRNFAFCNVILAGSASRFARAGTVCLCVAKRKTGARSDAIFVSRRIKIPDSRSFGNEIRFRVGGRSSRDDPPKTWKTRYPIKTLPRKAQSRLPFFL